jgi:hypothetical protein
MRHLAQVEARVLGFASGGKRHWIGAFALETAYHGVALALGAVPSVTIALVRKARILCRTALGIRVLLRSGWSPHLGSVAHGSPLQMQPRECGR